MITRTRKGHGEGLMLNHHMKNGKSISANWTVRVWIKGKMREIGLGSLRDMSLAQARTLAAIQRKLARLQNKSEGKTCVFCNGTGEIK